MMGTQNVNHSEAPNANLDFSCYSACKKIMKLVYRIMMSFQNIKNDHTENSTKLYYF